MNIIHEISSPEEKEAFFNNNPERLCKYRFWDDNYHKRLVTDGELFYSSPSRFNDPYDCGLPFRQHPENFDPVIIKEKVEATAPKIFPEIADNKKALEEACARQVLLIQQDPKSWFEMNWGYRPEHLNKVFGVLSLTPHPDNYLMWSHYANSHKGFCVEFDTRLLVESIAGHFQKVIYTDEIPFFSIRDNLEKDLLGKLVYTKSKIWEYEDEYRFSRIHRPDTAIKFNPEALKTIYFGANTLFEHQVEIIDLAKKLFPNVVFKKMELDKESFKLKVGDIGLI